MDLERRRPSGVGQGRAPPCSPSASVLAPPPTPRSLLALFDEAVAWLVARGQPGQWGTVPWSQRPSAVGHVKAWAHGPGLRIAEEPDATALGALVLGARPPHVEPIDEPERYVEALVTSRRHAGRGIGARP